MRRKRFASQPISVTVRKIPEERSIQQARTSPPPPTRLPSPSTPLPRAQPARSTAIYPPPCAPCPVAPHHTRYHYGSPLWEPTHSSRGSQRGSAFRKQKPTNHGEARLQPTLEGGAFTQFRTADLDGLFNQYLDLPKDRLESSMMSPLPIHNIRVRVPTAICVHSRACLPVGAGSEAILIIRVLTFHLFGFQSGKSQYVGNWSGIPDSEFECRHKKKIKFKIRLNLTCKDAAQ